MVLKLFGDSDGSDDDVDKISNIEINQEFARRYEHNKTREDLQRLGELKKKGLAGDSSGSDGEEESSEEEEQDPIEANRKNLKFFDALIKVRNQDPILKDKDAKLFESESDSETEAEDGTGEKVDGKRSKKEKPMYLKDVVSKHLIEEGPEFEDKEGGVVDVKSYEEEQEELRRAFLDAAEDGLGEDDDGEELLKMKENGDKDLDDEEDSKVKEKLDEYFGEDGKVDENMMFLKDYFRKKMWMDKEKDWKGAGKEEMDFSDDEEEIEKQEDYERDYNFRFEENAGDRVMGYSRFVEGSVRKKTNARQLQRKSKEERMAKAELERKEELKHLKNLKKKEINEKLRKARVAAGIGDEGLFLLDEDDVEEEFDPDEYDRKMKEVFNAEYYETEDTNLDFGRDSDAMEKLDFDKEDELLGLPKGWDDANESREGFLACREKHLKHRLDNKAENEPEEGEEEMVAAECKRKKKLKMSNLENEVLLKELDEYYKLDYEDTIEDLKTRFKYGSVPAASYGLSIEDILIMDEKESNQYVSMKKLAPYREKEWMVPRHKRYNQKLRNKSFLQAEISNSQKNGKKHSRDDGQVSARDAHTVENNKPQAEESNATSTNLSRQSRRRRRQAEFKLSLSRLKAYGKVPSKAKHKTKH